MGAGDWLGVSPSFLSGGTWAPGHSQEEISPSPFLPVSLVHFAIKTYAHSWFLALYFYVKMQKELMEFCQELHPRFLGGNMFPGIWAIIHCLPRRFRWILNQKLKNSGHQMPPVGGSRHLKPKLSLIHHKSLLFFLSFLNILRFLQICFIVKFFLFHYPFKVAFNDFDPCVSFLVSPQNLSVKREAFMLSVLQVQV